MNKFLRAAKNLVKNPYLLYPYMGSLGFLNWLSDAAYLKGCFRAKMGYKLDLENPQTFNEKLQWLKLYDRNPAYTQMVDKYAVREYIKNTIGEEYLIPFLGVWDSFDEIDFDALPEQFVLKTNHDSGTVVICKDKKTFDIEAAREKINKRINYNYYHLWREWPYKNVKHKIIAEEFMVDSDGVDGLTDYKFFCFNGYVDCVMVCLDRFTGDTKFYFFNEEWELLRYNIRGRLAPADFSIPKLGCMDEMFDIARRLSKGIPYVRVDLYAINGKTYFGELTFFPDSGFDANLLAETDEYFGKLIEIKN